MVFTGDHFNNPEALTKLQETGVLSYARKADLEYLVEQETDLLLHEAGAPPIHTPLDVLMKLPKKVKDRLYVVHTSALPEGCELKVAPTGTAGTIRLDVRDSNSTGGDKNKLKLRRSSMIPEDIPLEDSIYFKSLLTQNEYSSFGDISLDSRTSFAHSSGFASDRMGSDSSGSGRSGGENRRRLSFCSKHKDPPLVSLRPASSTDAWFILNLLSTVPFLSDLSYASTMEVLEVARVDAFCIHDVVVPAERRRAVLCVVWEGTCMEREQSSQLATNASLIQPLMPKKGTPGFTSCLQISQGRHAPLSGNELNPKKRVGVWQAGDWTGPRSLQPEKRLSGESSISKTHDIVAMSQQGVKVITVEFAKLHAILKSGSPLYCRYQQRARNQAHGCQIPKDLENRIARQVMQDAVKNLNVMELIESNTALVKLSAVQKRHLECLAEGPVFYRPGSHLWKTGASVDRAFIIVAGGVSFVLKEEISLVGQDKNGVITIMNKSHGSFGRMSTSRRSAQGLVYSRGHFLGNISKMVAGLLAEVKGSNTNIHGYREAEVTPTGEVEISKETHELLVEHSLHSSSLVAGPGGCVAIFFSKSNLTAFLDKYPGFLLSLLGTQVIT